MSDKKIRLRVVTPVATKVDEAVDMVILRCTTGELGILPGHSDYSAVLDYGVMRVHNNDAERHLAVYGGLAVMRDGVLSILTNDAQWPDDLSQYSNLTEDADSVELLNDQVRLRRALVQIEVGTSTIRDQE